MSERTKGSNLLRSITKATSSKINRRSFLKSTGATALSLGLAGNLTTAIAQRAPGMTVGLFGEPAGLNPMFRMGIQGNHVAANIHRKLTRINFETRRVEPELATDWATEDPLTWVVRLRDDVKWHKGYGDFTAEDVAYTLNYQIENSTFQVGTALFPVERINVRDRNTVEVKLKQPFSPFPLITMEYGGYMICKAAHEEMGPEVYARNAIGTGPFQLESWNSGSSIRIVRNPEYWIPDRPLMDEIVFRFLPDASVRLASLERGEIDLMGSPDPEDIRQIRNNGIEGIQSASVAGWNWDYMAFTFPPNIEAEFPTQIKEVRQAISYAIDRQILVDEIYAGDALVTDSPVPPGFLSYREVPIRYPRSADLQRAKDLMAQAGVSGFDLEVITSDKEWLRRQTELVGAMLSEIGINVRPQGLDVGTWTERWIGSRNFQALLEDISITSPDVDSTMFWFHREGTVGHHGWPNQEITQLLDEGRIETDRGARERIYHQAVDIIQEECPYIYLSHVNYTYLHDDQLTGFVPSPQEYILILDNVAWS